jgi:hypothetical protein
MSAKSELILSNLLNLNVSIQGATQIRADVLRPEVIGPPLSLIHDQGEKTVKIVRGPWFGEHGIIIDTPAEPQTLESGVIALVYLLQLKNGKTVEVPKANVEIM